MTTMDTPPDLQFETLSTLWELGSATVRDVHERLGAPRGLAYTTIATVLDRLHTKGVVTRTHQGRALVYAPAGERQAFERGRAEAALSRLLGPDPAASVATLVDALADIDPDLLDELERAIAAKREDERGS